MSVAGGQAVPSARATAGQVLRRWIGAGDGLAVIAVILLAAASAWLAPSSLSPAALYAMFPFAAILGVAAIGQQLVVQQRGLDLSAGGAISLVCVLATYALPETASLPEVLGRCLMAGSVAAIVGFVNGVLIVRFRIAPSSPPSA